MNKYAFCLVLITLIELIACPQTLVESQTVDIAGGERMISNECRIIVNGNILNCPGYIFKEEDVAFVLIPLVNVLEELGGLVSWTSENKARISINNETLVLDMTKGTLLTEKGFNILLLAPGSEHGKMHMIINGVFYIDNDSALLLLRSFLQTSITKDFSKAIYSIESATIH